MTAEYPVYQRLLPLLPHAQVVDFIAPEPHELLTDYAARMADLFPPCCVIAGVSFGGILALEIARIIQPVGCILIASISTPNELPPWLRAWRIFGGRHSESLLNALGRTAAAVPQRLRTKSTIRLTKLAGESGAWHRWATSAVIDWNPVPEPISTPTLQIHGDADSTFPIRYTNPDIVIPNGRHALPMSHPSETAIAINAFTNRISTRTDQSAPGTK